MSGARKADGGINVDALDRDPALDGVRGFALSMVLLGHGLRVVPYHGVEAPMLRLKRYFAPKKASPQNAVAAAPVPTAQASLEP